jgi:hypothetical protein
MKIHVVVMAPYPVPLDSGRHLHTGEIALVEQNSYIESCVNSGKLAVVEIPEPPAPPKSTPVKSEPESKRDN